MTRPLLETEGLTRAFGGLLAVSDVSLCVMSGEIVGLIGPNGAGKTTLFNMLAGSLEPTKGRIRFEGLDVTGWPADEMAWLGVTRTFQITSLFPSLTVADNVLAATHRSTRRGWLDAVFRSRAWRQDEAKARILAEEVLEFCDLDGSAGVRAADLSYGEQRRLEVAIALAATPRLLLLDEPAAGLNPEEGQRLLARKRLGEAVVPAECDGVAGPVVDAHVPEGDAARCAMRRHNGGLRCGRHGEREQACHHQDERDWEEGSSAAPAHCAPAWPAGSMTPVTTRPGPARPASKVSTTAGVTAATRSGQVR